MKKSFLTLGIFAILAFGFLPLAAQDFDAKVKADTILAPGGKCQIELSVTGGTAPFTYLIYDNEPWNGGKLIEKSSATNQLTYSFFIANAGRFVVAVRDKNNFTKIFTVQIKLTGTAFLREKPTGIKKSRLA